MLLTQIDSKRYLISTSLTDFYSWFEKLSIKFNSLNKSLLDNRKHVIKTCLVLSRLKGYSKMP